MLNSHFQLPLHFEECVHMRKKTVHLTFFEHSLSQSTIKSDIRNNVIAFPKFRFGTPCSWMGASPHSPLEGLLTPIASSERVHKTCYWKYTVLQWPPSLLLYQIRSVS